MMHYELQRATQADILRGAERRRLVREARQAAKAARAEARRAASEDGGNERRERFARAA
jgi:hypothetical protein